MGQWSIVWGLGVSVLCTLPTTLGRVLGSFSLTFASLGPACSPHSSPTSVQTVALHPGRDLSTGVRKVEVTASGISR